MSTEIEVNKCFANDLLIMNENFLLSLLFNLRTLSQVLATVIKLF